MPAESQLLEPVSLKLELKGRLRNVGKLKHWYVSIAEAVQNSMDSLLDSGTGGKITVTIRRTDDLASRGGANRPVDSVEIEDQGVGFDNANFESFCTPDSVHKLARGGKGLGRFLCLQAFHRVEIDSVYQDGASRRRRRAVLQFDNPQLSALDQPANDSVQLTKVVLETLRDDYSSTASVSPETIVDWLIEHFLPVLVEKPGWLEAFIVRDGKKPVDLTKLVEGRAAWKESFEIRTYGFDLVCYAISNEAKANKLRLVAAGRIVDANTQPVEHYLPHLTTIADGTPHLILVRSPFFDEHVNDARNGVSFSEEPDGSLLGVSASEFRAACAGAMRKRLEGRLSESINLFKRRISEVVTKCAPYYRPLLGGFFESKEFSGLSSACRDEDILVGLDTFKRKDAERLRTESRRIARLKTEEIGYWESARKVAAQIEMQKKVALAEYVTLRKIVLDRLEQLIELGENGKPHREAAIHDLIFPQRTDSESSPGVDHQLWIVDERLESHEYLASDQPIDRKQGDRPDLLIALDTPGAFACEPFSKSAGYERVVLVEFKQALKELTSVPTDELPHQQMMRYADKIERGKAQHFGSGRLIVASKARFYMYAICELSEDLLKRLEKNGFTRSPTGDGAFWPTNNGRYYVEYISLPKLLEDAKSRNFAFFRKLGLEG
ncbi:MAG: ATP-binding protein [Chthoniobacteraceae bacterium]